MMFLRFFYVKNRKRKPDAVHGQPEGWNSNLRPKVTVANVFHGKNGLFVQYTGSLKIVTGLELKKSCYSCVKNVFSCPPGQLDISTFKVPTFVVLLGLCFEVFLGLCFDFSGAEVTALQWRITHECFCSYTVTISNLRRMS